MPHHIMVSVAFLVAGILGAFGDKEGHARSLDDAKLFAVHVLSQAKNLERRRVIRSTWASRVDTTFYVGLSADNAVNAGLFIEKRDHNDLVIVPMLEDYYGITQKTRWILNHAGNGFSYTMKCDDDTYVRVGMIRKMLASRDPSKLEIIGKISRNGSVLRSGKWGVSRKDYPGNRYPTMPAGPGYILSRALVKTLRKSDKSNHLTLEDVSVGIWISRLKEHVDFVHMHFSGYGCQASSFIFHYVSAVMMQTYGRREASGSAICG